MMKRILSALSLLFVIVQSYAQTATENYIQSRSYLEPVTISDTTAKQVRTVQYFDGLGRLKQLVNVKVSPLGKDVVTHVEYDPFERQVKDFLPIPQSGTHNGAIIPTPLANAPAVYGSEKIYAEKTLENSPLDRIQQQIHVGTAWTNKPTTFQYSTNAENEVYKFTTNTTWVNNATSSVLVLEYFPANQLYKNMVTDEDGNSIIEYKNGQGQIVLVSKEGTNTYYVYNEYNQLAFVIPPKALTGPITEAVLNDLCYQYRYDRRGRLVEKKLPGKGWEYMVYNKADQLVMSQDANLRAQNKWMLTKYDQFERVVLTGITSNTATRQTLQANITAATYTFEIRSIGSFTVSGMPIYYTNRALPASLAQVLTINYYDSYPGYSFNPPFPLTIQGETVLTETSSADGRSTKGLPVLSLVKNIEDDNWTKNYTYYDTKGRAVGSHSINHLGGYTKTESKLDFAGVPQAVITRHKRLDADPERVITENFTYDHQNRLLTHTHQVGSNPVEYLAQNKYNELSQLESKKVGGIAIASPLQTIDYKYNIRGWMTQINDPVNLNGKLFGYKIKYIDPVYADIAPGRYNGNIAEIDWNTSTVNNLKRYNYTYDKLNRLTDAEYAEPNTTNPHNKNFDERLTYDVNGNIASLKRNAIPVSGTTSTTVDNLVYEYTGNRLNKVTENALNDTGYEGGNNIIDYDLNGNMTTMKDKGIQGIVYNYLDLPNTFSITETDPFLGQTLNVSMDYLYRADGVKLRKNYYKQGRRGSLGTTHIIDYLDGFQYSYFDGGAPCITCRTETAYEEQAYGNIIDFPIGGTPEWKLDFVPTSEGFYSFTENRYIYQYRDHLGNARVSFVKNSEGVLEVTDTNNYYPFGLNHIEGMFGNSKLGGYYSYKYNGKELQETGMYDYGARFYMPDLGRWGVVDPLAEKHPELNPMMYAANNPIVFIDPDGRDWSITQTYDKKTNTTHYQITFTGAVLNSSSNKKIDMKKFASTVQSQTEAIFNKIDNNPNITVSANINIRTIDDKEDLKSTDTLIEIKDSSSKEFDVYKDKKTDVVGRAMNGKEIYVNEKYINDLMSGENSKTLPHEIGHTGGLQHPAMATRETLFDLPETFSTLKSNFMIQGAIRKPTGLNVHQINRMYRLYKAGKLNNRKIEPRLEK